MTGPLISVCIITYNHAEYIRQAIDSVLVQKHDYSWEVIIADDNSTDGTTEIILEYQARYPELIKPIIRRENVGAYKNWIDLLTAAKGKYTAYLEGDDFWSDYNKINEQTVFMENNYGYVGCFHNTEERFENNIIRSSFLYCNFQGENDIGFDKLAFANLIPSCSMFFITELAHKIPPWVGKLKMGDWPFHLVNSTFGKYKYLPKVMGVHRLHNKSTWMVRDRDKNIQSIIEAYDEMINEFVNQEIYLKSLVKGKAAFIDSVRLDKDKLTFKKRIKWHLVKLIEKL